MREERITFTGAAGEPLAGRLRVPVGPPRGCAVLAHCFTCGKDLRAARKISEALAGVGLAVLRFDFTGLGQSEGAFADTTFVSNVADLVAAVGWLEAEVGSVSLIVGHSLGGTAAIAAAARLPSVRAVATIGAPFAPGHAAWILDPVRAELERRGQAELVLGGRTLIVGRALLDDLEQASIEGDLRSLRRPLLIAHAPLDATVGIDNARALYEAARHPKTFVALDGADHLLTDAADASWIGEMIAAWVGKVLPAAPAAPEALDEGQVQVVTAAGLRTEVRSGRHRWVADEPVRLGGEDAGPTPYDLLLAAHGTCTGMTLRMYADRKELPLEEVTVTLAHHREHQRDCAECGDAGRRIDVIDRQITLVGDLTEAQRGRLLEIADRCPVHWTLHGPIEVRTTETPTS